jgi:hypothetical protein
MLLRHAPLATLVATALFAAAPAMAVTSTRTQVQNATGACQGALPSFDTNLRQRPLGVNNEGSAVAFVSCGLKSSDFDDAMNTYSGVVLSNASASDVDVNCTLVSGTVVDTPVYFTKTATILANTTGQFLIWDTTDNGGNPIPNTLNWSCQLPPGVQLNNIFTNVDVDVGA